MTTLLLIGICALSSVTLTLSYHYIIKRKLKTDCEKNEFEYRYRCAQYFIQTSAITAENYDIINRMICSLNKLPHRNKEKMEVLYVNQFLVKFEAEHKRRLSLNKVAIVNVHKTTETANMGFYL